MEVVLIGSNNSELKSVMRSISEGSVIGPQLFLIYINEIYDGSKCCSYKLFVHDLKISFMFKHDDDNIAMDGVPNELICIEKYACD